MTPAHRRKPARRTAATTATAFVGVAVAVGLTTTGSLGALGLTEPSTENTAAAAASQSLDFTRDPAVDPAQVDRGQRKADKRVEARRDAKLAAKRAAEARAAAAHRAREARAAKASRSQVRGYGGDPRSIARSMMAAKYGWGSDQFSCLDSLWVRESGWNVHASNPSSGAYGIPQALPGSKMSTAGSDWQDNPATQIAWGLQYIRSSYSTPCGAWSGFQSQGWY